jgi:hypothetical protein
MKGTDPSEPCTRMRAWRCGEHSSNSDQMTRSFTCHLNPEKPFYTRQTATPQPSSATSPPTASQHLFRHVFFDMPGLRDAAQAQGPRQRLVSHLVRHLEVLWTFRPRRYRVRRTPQPLQALVGLRLQEVLKQNMNTRDGCNRHLTSLSAKQ